MSQRAYDRLYRFLHELGERGASITEAGTLLRMTLRATRDFMKAAHACAVVIDRPGAEPAVEFNVPANAAWDGIDRRAFVRGAYPAVPPDVIGAAVRRFGRSWGAFILRRPGGFAPGEGRALARITARVSEAFGLLDQRRVEDVRQRLDRKVMEQLRPRDLFYQVLHGLRTLTRYDHSSALLLCDAGGQWFELAAEQLACRKGKSRRIGARIAVDDAVRSLLRDGRLCGFDYAEGAWRGWTPAASDALARWLDFERQRDGESDVPAAGALLCAPIVTRLGTIGLLRLASLRPGAFGRYEADILGQFTPHASVAIQYLQRTEALESKMVAAEKKHALATIARGVSHDINNALGAVLPLVQQLRCEAQDNRIDPRELALDLAQIEQSVQTSRRIFAGMLNLGRGGARSLGAGNLRRAIDGALAILGDSLKRRGISLDIDLPTDLPAVQVGQADLSQLFLNLATNARDAMPGGGRLSIRASPASGAVEIELRDNGSGIDPMLIERIGEPFFTTKPDGHGLGLSICRSIIWEARGRMTIDSPPGGGTRVRLTLPVLARDAEPRAAKAAT
ncbi:MAG TPA: ATP-binding protein [Phycisphaerae bacterium]|nr:ATP-binding protein [Phycisphaerae bacterium]